MRFHPVQHDVRALEKIALAFSDRMLLKGILPKNPWKAKRVHEWLARMGARMRPGDRHYDCFRGQVDCSNYVNFKVECIRPKWRVPGGLRRYKEGEPAFMRIEIPWELADKILALGYLP
jgi:hypothetical protein